MRLFLLTAFFSLCFPCSTIFKDSKLDISIRHDKKDSQYIELGEKFPSVAKVGLRGGDGTLIAPQWVITAAHVAEGMYRRKGKNLKVYFENNPNGYEVDLIFIHPDFAPMQGSDIALIKLKTSVKGIKPSELYTLTYEKKKEIIIVGHGDFKTGLGGEWKVDGIKRGATNIIDEVTDSQIIFDFDTPPNGTELEGTAGRGDSGGPALIKDQGVFKIAGISSMGRPGKNGPGTYGAIEYYTRVSSYLKWLEKTMKNPTKNNALSNKKISSRENGRKGKLIRKGNGDQPLKGLGLILIQENNKIRIVGKADPLVPKAFRNVMFKPPSFLVSFNKRKCRKKSDFLIDFKKIKKGEKFTIQFNVQGALKSFEAIKL